MSKYINPYTDFGLSWDITNAMNDAESKGFKKSKKEGEKLGIEKGLAEGEKKASLENAHKMKLKGFSVEDIIDVTGLSKNEIENLR